MLILNVVFVVILAITTNTAFSISIIIFVTAIRIILFTRFVDCFKFCKDDRLQVFLCALLVVVLEFPCAFDTPL